MTSSFLSWNYTTQKLRMVQKQACPDFPDRKHEWRRLFAEARDTFLLLLVAAKNGGAVRLGMIIVAYGLMAMAVVLTTDLKKTILGTTAGARNIGANGAITGAGSGARRPPFGLNPCRRAAARAAIGVAGDSDSTPTSEQDNN